MPIYKCSLNTSNNSIITSRTKCTCKLWWAKLAKCKISSNNKLKIYFAWTHQIKWIIKIYLNLYINSNNSSKYTILFRIISSPFIQACKTRISLWETRNNLIRKKIFQLTSTSCNNNSFNSWHRWIWKTNKFNNRCNRWFNNNKVRILNRIWTVI